MIKKIFVFLACSALFYHASFSEALEVTVLKGSDIKPYNDALEGFKSSCDCETKEFIISDTENRNIEERVLESRPDMILAVGMDALIQVQGIKDIPVVYTMTPYSPHFNHPKKNLSGVIMYFSPEKYLDAMLDIFPAARRIGVVYDPKNSDVFLREAMQAAQSRGIELVVKKASRPGEVPSLIDGMKDRIDLLWMLPDTTVINSETINYMLLFSFQNKVPLFTFSKKYVEMGALASLNIVPFDLGVQAGEIARRLIVEKDSKTPIKSYARKSVLTVNKKVAKKLGIKMRAEVLNRAENAD
jgi:putative ABC transport system substrate-binding protein